MTFKNSVSFQPNQRPTQDYMENYPFFQQNKNKQQKPHYTDYVSSDDDHLPDIFEPYLQEYRTRKPQRNQYKRNFPENPPDFQDQQPQVPLHIIHNFSNQYKHKIQ